MEPIVAFLLGMASNAAMFMLATYSMHHTAHARKKH